MSDPVSSSALPRLLVGLGNPGREYHETRHNVGFMVLDRLAREAGVSFARQGKADVARLDDLILCKPMSYMNLSGEPVGALARFYQLAPEQLFVVLDDLALPLGKLRLRLRGSPGGHNGLKSIIQHLGGDAIPRLRIGIGAAQPGDAVDYVLGHFRPAERVEIEISVARAAEAILFARTNGLPAAMNQFN